MSGKLSSTHYSPSSTAIPGLNPLAQSLLFKTSEITELLLADQDLDFFGFVEFYIRVKVKSLRSVIHVPTHGVASEDPIDSFLNSISPIFLRDNSAGLLNFDTSVLSHKQSLSFVKDLVAFRHLTISSELLIQKAISACLKACDSPEPQENESTFRYLEVLCGAPCPSRISPEIAIKYAFTIIKTSVVNEAGDLTEELLRNDLKKLFDAGVSPQSCLPPESTVAGEYLEKGCPLISYAAMNASPGILSSIISRADVDLEFNSSDSQARPIHYAINCNNFENVKVLVLAGADLSAKTANGGTALLIAIFRGFDAIALYLSTLPQAGVNIESHGIFTALNIALIYNKKSLIESLLQRRDINFSSLSKLYKFLQDDLNKVEGLSINDIYPAYREHIDSAAQKDSSNTLKNIIKRIEALTIPNEATKEQHLAFGREMLDIHTKTALIHLDLASKTLKGEVGNAAIIAEAISLAVPKCLKEAPNIGYSFLVNAINKAKKHQIKEHQPLIDQLDFLKTIAEHEHSTKKAIGKSLVEIQAQRDSLNIAKLKFGIPSKKTFEENSDLLEILRKISVSETSDLEKYLLKLTDPVRKKAFDDAFKEIRSTLAVTKDFTRNKGEIKNSFVKLNEFFKIIAKDLDKQDVKNIETLYGITITSSIEKYSVALKTYPDMVSLEAFKMFGIPVKASAVSEAGGGAASSHKAVEDLNKFEADEAGGGAGGGAASGRVGHHQIEINARTLVMFAKNFDPNNKTPFCEKVIKAIAYAPKTEAGRDKYWKSLNAVLTKENLDGSTDFPSLIEDFKFIFSKQVPGHFIRAFLHASNDETLSELFTAVDSEGSVATGLTGASVRAQVKAPVTDLATLRETLPAMTEDHEDDKGSFDEKEELTNPVLYSQEILENLYNGNYENIYVNDIQQLIDELNEKGYEFEFRWKDALKFDIIPAEGDVILGHRIHQGAVGSNKSKTDTDIRTLQRLKESLAEIFPIFIEEARSKTITASAEQEFSEHSVELLKEAAIKAAVEADKAEAEVPEGRGAARLAQAEEAAVKLLAELPGPPTEYLDS